MRMSSLYNRFAGQRLDPVQALSDGVFAVAMTLLVLDLRVPLGIGDSNQALWRALAELGPSLAAYVLSFTLLDLCARSDRNLTWLQPSIGLVRVAEALRGRLLTVKPPRRRGLNGPI